MSIAYYDERAAEFFHDTAHAEMAAAHARFLRHLKAGAHILDAGCGSGRDTAYFAQAGYRVTAFDSSVEMVRLASAKTGLFVIRMLFNEVDWDRAFNGIWACASLLHVPRAELGPTAGRLVRALVPGGVIFMSFKLGEAERHRDGRHFTEMTEQYLADLSAEVGLDMRELWLSTDTRADRRHERWVSAIGQRSTVRLSF